MGINGERVKGLKALFFAKKICNSVDYNTKFIINWFCLRGSKKSFKK